MLTLLHAHRKTMSIKLIKNIPGYFKRMFKNPTWLLISKLENNHREHKDIYQL